MGWGINQIWLGFTDPPPVMEKTKELADKLGFKYTLWNWQKLTSTFGFSYFGNFNVFRPSEQVARCIVKYYVWYVLDFESEDAMFLDAGMHLPFIKMKSGYFSEPGVYLAPGYDPWFIACNNKIALQLAKAQVRRQLDIRYRANGEWMFSFISQKPYNLFGKRFMHNYLIPLWQHNRINVYEHANPKRKPRKSSGEKLLPPPGPITAVPIMLIAEKPTVLPSGPTSNIKDKSLKLPAVSAQVPETSKRIIIVGNDSTGLTDLQLFAQPKDVLVHLNQCPLLSITKDLRDVKHAVFFDSPIGVPLHVQFNKGKYIECSRLYPSSSFTSYNWYSKISGTVSTPVALACSYKEKNPKLSVMIYGHNTADDILHNYDTELEELLLHANNIEAYTPQHEVLFLILSRQQNAVRRILCESTWLKYTQFTKHTWRFAYSRKSNITGVSQPRTWVFVNPLNEADFLYRALANASHMKFKYIFLCRDTTAVHPLNLWKWILSHIETQAFGRRYYHEEQRMLAYNLNAGVCLSRDTVDTILPYFTPGALESYTSAEGILAAALHDMRIPLENVADLFTADEDRKLPSASDDTISAADCSEEELKLAFP